MSVATRTRYFPFLKPASACGPLRLRPVAVNPLGLDAVLHQILRQPVGAVLGAGEHERVLHLAPLQQRSSSADFSSCGTG